MKKTPVKTIQLIANGDLRQAANEYTWPFQKAMEKQLTAAVAKLGGAGEKPKKSEGEKKKGGARDAKGAREAIDAARVKAMQKAEPSLKIDVIRAYVE